MYMYDASFLPIRDYSTFRIMENVSAIQMVIMSTLFALTILAKHGTKITKNRPPGTFCLII